MVTKEILEKFCDPENARYHIDKPWSIDDVSLATDGKILIRVPRLQDVPECGDAPGALHIFNDNPPPSDNGQWQSLPSCKECDGKAQHIFKTEFNEYTCPCKTCRGTGMDISEEDVQNLMVITIGPMKFQTKYLALIKMLPNAMIYPNDDLEKPSWFRFDSGDGLIMPVRA
jgi:hypothetical protein